MKIRSVFKKLFLPITTALSLTVMVSSCGNVAEQLGSIGGGGLNFDSKERQIIGQARGVGILLGAGTGYAIAKNNNESEIGGVIAGGVAGGVLGDLVGKKQARNARNARLNNDQLKNLLTRARANNKRLADYNRNLKKRVAECRAAEPAKRKQLAKASVREADRAIAKTDKLVSERKKNSVNLVSSQRAQYNRETAKAQSLRGELARSRNSLAGMY